MNTFRIGNEIQVRWPILTNGIETPLTGRNLKLFLSDDTGRKKEVVFNTERNYVYFNYSPLEQKHVGVYFLTLFEDMGTEHQLCVDTCAFRLVAHSYGIPSDLNVKELELDESELTTMRGRSAYEIAVLYGYEGTEEEWAAQYNTVLTSIETMEEQVAESRETLNRLQELEREMVDIHNEEFPISVAVYPVVIQLVEIFQIGQADVSLVGTTAFQNLRNHHIQYPFLHILNDIVHR